MRMSHSVGENCITLWVMASSGVSLQACFSGYLCKFLPLNVGIYSQPALEEATEENKMLLVGVGAVQERTVSRETLWPWRGDVSLIAQLPSGDDEEDDSQDGQGNLGEH